jgi:hypothetical protein
MRASNVGQDFSPEAPQGLVSPPGLGILTWVPHIAG